MEKSKQDYVDTEYSSGDSKMIKSKQKFTEENNNEVEELTKDFSEMGCIVNPDKRPSNICIETCVYEESSGEEEPNENDDVDGYSDEFEDEKSEEEELKLEPVSPKGENETDSQNDLAVKLVNSRSSMSSKPPTVTSGRSTSNMSFVPTTRRANMSFSNDRLREIERHNHILLNKILEARHKRPSLPPRGSPRRPPPAAAVQRKQAQRKIDHDNMDLTSTAQAARTTSLLSRQCVTRAPSV